MVVERAPLTTFVGTLVAMEWSFASMDQSVAVEGALVGKWSSTCRTFKGFEPLMFGISVPLEGPLLIKTYPAV